jgi:8-oxo-dGTP pyrophosphatase MutT (NUDIX family)
VGVGGREDTPVYFGTSVNLFQALPCLRRHPLIGDKHVVLIGVSTVVSDGTALVFEVSRPKYWRQREDGATLVGVGGIGGSVEQGESVLACLRREVKEELGARVRLDRPPQTYLIRDWQVVDTLVLPSSRRRPTPLMVILVPPRLGGPQTPDHLAILAFRTRLRDTAEPRDLFGLLRVENQALGTFFGRDEWPLGEVQAHPGLTVTLNGDPPPSPILYPVLTGRAFQLLVRSGYL